MKKEQKQEEEKRIAEALHKGGGRAAHFGVGARQRAQHLG